MAEPSDDDLRAKLREHLGERISIMFLGGGAWWGPYTLQAVGSDYLTLLGSSGVYWIQTSNVVAAWPVKP